MQHTNLFNGGNELVLDTDGQSICVLHLAHRGTNGHFARALFDVERLLLDGVALDAQPLARGTQALAFLADRLGSCSKSYIFHCGKDVSRTLPPHVRQTGTSVQNFRLARGAPASIHV